VIRAGRIVCPARPQWKPLKISARGLEMPRRAGQSSTVNQAFILGAGLGTRLRPLTDHLPKPLVPLFHEPLAWWTMAACMQAGIRRFAINTHHLPHAWNGFAEGCDITLFHEPLLLETGGGLKNIEPWIGNEALLVHNGDIFATLPLKKLIAAHEASGLPVTLALRSHGNESDKRIALDESFSRVTDIRHSLGIAKGTHVFSGIYCVNPSFTEMIAPGVVVPVIPAFLDLVKRGQLGAIVLDEGEWLDLGDRKSYLKAHQTLKLGPAIHPEAIIENGAVIENSVIGPDALIRSGAVVRNSVIWPGGRVSSNAILDGCIVCSGREVEGVHRDEDL
jgi:mannose-1-phosphate guanylyltransferase